MKIILLDDVDKLSKYKKSLHHRDVYLHVLFDETSYLEVLSKNFIINYTNSHNTLENWITYINKYNANNAIFLLATKNIYVIRRLKKKFCNLEIITE